MNIREFLNQGKLDGTYDVTWDENKNPIFTRVEFGDGYMVSVGEGWQPFQDEYESELKMGTLWEHLVQNSLDFEVAYLGVWTDDRGSYRSLHIDTSFYTGSRHTAEVIGRQNNQLAIWDNKNGEAIEL